MSVSSTGDFGGDLLYPRLPHAVAEELHEVYQSMVALDLRDRSQLSHPDATLTAVGGVAVSQERLDSLRQRTRMAAELAGFPDRGTQKTRSDFDLECARILLDSMNVAPAEAASGEIWAFLALVVLPDVAYWRFPQAPGDRVLGTDLTRHVFARQWWRAYQLTDLTPNSGLEALKRISESEMNQLFERRHIGGNRQLVRCIARAICEPAPHWSQVGSRALVRDALKRIRRLLPFVMFESLTDEALKEMVLRLFDESAERLMASGNAGAQEADEDALEEGLDQQTPSPPPPSKNEMGGRPNVSFDDVRLADVPLQVAQLVVERGGLSDDNLCAEYSRRFGVTVESDEQKVLLNKFAWSAKGRRFIERDEDNGLWLPGTTEPRPVGELGMWTINRIRARARDMLEGSPQADPFDDLLREVYASDSRRTPRLVMSIVGKAIALSRREGRRN